MLTITPTASAALAALVESPQVPEGALLRIAHGPTPEGEPSLGLTVVDAPDPADLTVDTGAGFEIYVERETADELDDQQLDAEQQGDRIAFSLQRQALNGGPPAEA